MNGQRDADTPSKAKGTEGGAESNSGHRIRAIQWIHLVGSSSSSSLKSQASAIIIASSAASAISSSSEARRSSRSSLASIRQKAYNRALIRTYSVDQSEDQFSVGIVQIKVTK